MELRRMQYQDFDWFYEFAQDPEIGNNLGITNLTKKTMLKYFTGIYIDSCILVEDEELIGFISSKPAGKLKGLSLRNGVELNYAIKEEYRGQGIMKKALTKLIEANLDSFDYITLQIFNSNTLSIGLAKSLGFEAIYQEKLFTQDRQFKAATIFLLKK